MQSPFGLSDVPASDEPFLLRMYLTKAQIPVVIVVKPARMPIITPTVDNKFIPMGDVLLS